MKTTTNDAHAAARVRTDPARIRAMAAAALSMGLVLAAPGLLRAAEPAGTSPAAAGPTVTPRADLDALTQRLRSLYPSTRVDGVNPTAWPGVYEVVMGSNLAYVEAGGRYFLFGHLFDMQAQRDLTAERREALTRIEFGALPLADALTDVRGDGSRVFAVFSDPDCPYCRSLEAELRELTDVTIHTFLLPLESLHPEARGKAVSVWCAAQPLAAWRALMLDGVGPATSDCKHPVDRNVVLAERLGVHSTPTLIAADGRVLNGAARKDQLQAWLEGPKPGSLAGSGAGQPAAARAGSPSTADGARPR